MLAVTRQSASSMAPQVSYNEPSRRLTLWEPSPRAFEAPIEYNQDSIRSNEKKETPKLSAINTLAKESILNKTQPSSKEIPA